MPVRKSVLSRKQKLLVDDLLRPKNPIIKPIVDRFIRRYYGVFQGDIMDIRSICNTAVLTAVATYGNKRARRCACGQPTCTRVIRAAFRVMRNALYNRADALNTQKRGGRVQHFQIESLLDHRQATDYQAGDGTSEATDDEQTSEFPAARLAFANDNPLDNMIQAQTEEQFEARVASVDLTPRQRLLLNLARNPTRQVLALVRTKRKRALFFAAKRVAGASRADAKRVEHAVHEILS